MLIRARLAKSVIVVLTLLPWTACAGPRPGATAQPPQLGGTWLLNDRESDDLREKLGSGRPDGPTEQRLPGGNRERIAPTTSQLLAFSRVFKASQSDTVITFVAADGRRRELFPDGREVRQRLPGLGEVVTKARWKDDKLVVERAIEGGAKLTETYERALNGKKLYLEVKLSGGPRSIKFRRVYDAASEGG